MNHVAVPALASETVFHIGFFAVRNTMLMAWLAMLVLIIIAIALNAGGFRMVPGRFQSFIELIIETLYNFFKTILQDEAMTKKFFALPATIFLFFLVANWMGIIPGVGTVVVKTMVDGATETVPLFRSMNADVNMTLVIALICMIVVEAVGISSLGFKSYASKFFVPPWKDPLGTFIGLLELVSELTKIISFTFRLFGNIFAGEVLLVVVGFLVPYVAPVPFLGMEIFVGFIQAFVFAVLALAFMKMAMTSHGEHGAEVHG
ncbi:MAG TPA: F0F1 ATP synthase subunit A [Candidatus Peribacteraceae bacterium]|nr:F0F1 ATP synthase subunit A [Candidatus Peribacteraceae bacterium]